MWNQAFPQLQQLQHLEQHLLLLSETHSIFLEVLQFRLIHSKDSILSRQLVASRLDYCYEMHPMVYSKNALSTQHFQ